MSNETTIERPALSESALAFIETVKRDAAKAFAVFRSTNTITANGTVGFTQRIPGEDKLVSVSYPGPWHEDRPLTARVAGLDGTVYLGETAGSWLKLFAQHPDITTITHIHAPGLGAWSQSQRPLPIHYVPVQRTLFVRELPVYLDRRQSQEDFILEQLASNPEHSAILEANGGATVWGREGLNKLAQFILLLEEGANLQIAAEALGGSKPYGPGVLAQQWGRRGNIEKARALGFDV